jgi:uncharacterized protein (TIGR03663 family)
MSTFEEDQVNQTNSPAGSETQMIQERVSRLAIPTLTWELAAWVVLLFSSFFTRFWILGARVMSHDESEHAYFSWILSKGGGYSHNPMMHGPLLFEVTAFFDAIFKASDFTTRIAPALIGIVIVILVPVLLRPWLGRLGSLLTSLMFLVSPYVLYYSRYDRHDIYEIVLVLMAAFTILSYLRARAKEREDKEILAEKPLEEPSEKLAEEPPEQLSEELSEAPVEKLLEKPSAVLSERWLLLLAGIEALMFAAMETAFIYLAIFASFLVIRLLVQNGFHWKRLQQAAEFDLLVILATLGAFFSSQIALLAINPIWNRLTGQPFVPLQTLSSFGIDWSNGPYGLRIWGLMVVFWWAGAVVGIFWDWRRWWKPAALFFGITVLCYTTFFTNWAGIGTGFVGSLGYWLSQQGVARGAQPWYFYFIVFPLYEYLPILGGLVALVYFAIRRSRLSPVDQVFVTFVTWWAALIFTGLTLAGEKMPWLSTHITVPFILLSGWFVGHVLKNTRQEEEGETAPRFRWGSLAVGLPFAVLVLLTARTAYMVNYVNYDSVIEFADYAHGAPGVKWMVSDAQKIASITGQGSSMPVAFDSNNAWPLTWYLRDRTGFYGDQPNKATLQQTPMVIAGAQNWQKVEAFLGPDYNRYDIIRIWWPMEDYKNLTWDRIRGVFVDPQMRQAVWNILWNRDYSLYAKITNETLDAPKQWPLQDRMRVYIRKDLVAQVPDLQLKSSQMAEIPVKPDAYASKRISVAPIKVVQPEGLNMPRNLAIAPDGSIYIADSGNSRIVHLDAQGKVLNAFGSRTPDKQTPPAPGTFNEPWGVAVDAQGNVYVTDTWNHRVQKFDANGKFLLEWGVAGLSSDGSDRFWGPRGIAVGPGGNVYITDTGNRRVAVFDPQGKYLFEFSKEGNAQLNEPVGIAIDTKGRVYIADTWNARIAVFDAQGKFMTSWPVEVWNSTTVDEKPFLALDAKGRVYVTDPEGWRVLVFSSSGEALAAFGSFDTSQNGFNLPTGIVVGPVGDIWIADAGNNRLDVYPALK